MRELIKNILKPGAANWENEKRLREYLQEFFLFTLYRKKIYQQIVFCGGTALRFLYRLRRFSEDLDFSLSNSVKTCDFKAIVEGVSNEFIKAGYKLNVKIKEKMNVHSALFRFSQLLHEFNLSGLQSENVAIKFEIDTNHPQGGNEKNYYYQGQHFFYINHYDLSSLFAGKLHAIFCREYIKGRDFYDLLWYLGQKELAPNFNFLNNALQQTHSGYKQLDGSNWKNHIKERIINVDFDKVREDVRKFLDDEKEADLLIQDTFIHLLERI
jgi:predicted nucleotidyltransferase component of viral defense system